MKTVSIVALIHGPDRPGLVAHVAGWIYKAGGNILHADQHRDAEENVLSQRWLDNNSECPAGPLSPMSARASRYWFPKFLIACTISPLGLNAAKCVETLSAFFPTTKNFVPSANHYGSPFIELRSLQMAK